MNLKRNDRQYLDVEEFEDYELTQCIAYEMAFRNPDNVETIEHITKYYIRNKEAVLNYYELAKQIKKDPITGLLIGPLGGFATSILLNNYFFALDLIDFDNSYIYLDERFNKSFLELLVLERNRKNNRCTEKKLEINAEEDKINIHNKIEREGYTISTKLSAFHDNEDTSLKDTTISDINVNSVYKSQVIINERFKRPKINISHYHSLDTTLNINLNRPLKELIAYVKYIKDDLEKNKLMKSPIELLGIELSKADNLVCNDTGEKCFDPRSILSKQEKMADMFYVYDCLKLGYSQRKIQNEVYSYYADKNIETKTMDSNTLRKYREIAFDYIERGRYKEMLTGIKEVDLLKGQDIFYDDEDNID